MESASRNENEEDQTTSSRLDRLRWAIGKRGSCGCGFDGIIRCCHDLLRSHKKRSVSLDSYTTTVINPHRKRLSQHNWEWIGFSPNSRCVNFVDASCVGKLVGRNEEEDTDRVCQLKEQTKESLLRAHQAEHELEELHARQKYILDQLSAKERDLAMATRKIEIAEQDREHHLRQVKDELSLALSAKEEMREEMEQHVGQLTKERDEAVREKARLERPCWVRLVDCLGKVPGSQSHCCPDRLCVKRMSLPCLPIDRFMRLRTPKREISPQPHTIDSQNRVGEELQEVPVSVRPSSNPYRDSGRHDLINALLKSKWAYVSDWFEQQMRNVVEPLLQEQLATMITGIHIKIGDTCDLGNMPVQLENITAETCTEVMPDGGERIENIQISGSLNYHGNAMVDVGVSGLGDIGNLFITGLQVQGVVVIELVKLTQAPPWFSGVRIFFPNPPKVDIHLSTKLRGFHIDGWKIGTVPVGTIIKHQILQALDEKVLGRSVVLPNRVCVSLGERMEDVSLRHPRPQGVLRVAVLRAQGLRNIRSGGSWYVPWSKKTADDVAISPYAVITLGADQKQTRQCTRTLSPQWANEMYDLLVTDFDKQSLRITVLDHGSGGLGASDHSLGTTEVPLAKLAESCVSQSDAQPPALWLSLFSESGWSRVGHVMIQVQWRPFAQVNEITRAIAHTSNWWGFGDKSKACWLLAADIFYASGLPTCEVGTEHWAALTISGFRRHHAKDVPETQETPVAYAAGPFEHGLKLLDNIGLEKGVMIDEDRKQVGRTLWRRKVRLGVAAADQERSGARFVDVVWDCPLLFLMDRVMDVKVKISVLRPAKGRTRPPSGSTAVEILGTFEHTLRMQELGERMILDLHPALNNSGAELKVRLQASPLMAPTQPSSCQAGRNSHPVGQAADDTSSVGPISFAPELPPTIEGEVLSAPINGQPPQGSQEPKGWFSWAWRRDTAPLLMQSLETPPLQPELEAFKTENDEEDVFAPELLPTRKGEVLSAPINEQTPQGPEKPRGWFSWAWRRDTAPVLEQSLETPQPPPELEALKTANDEEELVPAVQKNHDVSWFTFRSRRHTDRDRFRSALSAYDSDEEALNNLFNPSDSEDLEELAEMDEVPQLSRFQRLRNWWHAPRPEKPIEVSAEPFSGEGLEDEVRSLQQEVNGDTTYPKTTESCEINNAETESCEISNAEASFEVQKRSSTVSEPAIPGVARSSSAWRIVNWWKGKGRAARNLTDDPDELSLMRENYSAPELIAFDTLCKQTSFREGSPERTPVPWLDRLSDHATNLSATKVYSDPMLVASVDDSADIRIANNTLGASHNPQADPGRHWLSFCRHTRVVPSVGELTDSTNSTSRFQTLSDSYDSTQTSTILSLGECATRTSVSSPPEVTECNEADDVACQPPRFIGNICGTSRNDEDATEGASCRRD